MAEGEGGQGDLPNGGADAAGADAGAAAAAAKLAADAGKAAAGEGDGKKPDAGKDGDGKAADAPIDYSGIKMPEGMKADDPVFADAVKLFGEHKLTPDAAQALVNFTADRDKMLVKAVNDGNTAAWTKMRGEWKADTEKNVSAEDRGAAKQFAEKIFDKKTADMLDAYGLTDHRGFVEAMVKAGKAIKDDTIVVGNAVNGAGSDARKMFPNSNMNP